MRASPEPAVVSSPATNAAERTPVALVELYTSEGCSSCPPADENLTRIAYAARSAGKRVIALSFHVDYWNYIGWKDPFSDPRYSERQRTHAGRLGSGVYTPQMVVAGREQLLGSRNEQADAAIRRALSRPASHVIRIQVREAPATIAFDVVGPAREAVVFVAVALGAREVSVKTGENAGRTLSHVNVVRSLASDRLRVPARGTLALEIPKGVDPGAAMVVGWVEDAQSGHVLGAVAKSGLLASRSP